MNDDRSKLVPFERPMRKIDPNLAAQFAETARRLRYERESAAELVARLLRETPRGQWSSLAKRAELQNAGALEHLSKEVDRRLDQSPQEALTIAQLATKIVDTLPRGAYPAVTLAQLHSHAWKDLGQALSVLSRYDDALAALEKAEGELAPYGALAHDQAIVWLVRATTLQEVRRYDESLALLNECRVIFGAHADRRRAMICGIAEGALLHRLHRHREARDLYLPLLMVARELRDMNSLACLNNVIGHSCVSLNELETAEHHLTEAIQQFHMLAQPLNATKAELARGRILLRRGQHAKAIVHLARIRDEFLRHELVEEAGLCGLDMVEGLLATDAAVQAETLARRIVHEFTTARLNERALTALGYLSEAIAARSASVPMVESVREYIHSLRTMPEREFVAYM